MIRTSLARLLDSADFIDDRRVLAALAVVALTVVGWRKLQELMTAVVLFVTFLAAAWLKDDAPAAADVAAVPVTPAVERPLLRT